MNRKNEKKFDANEVELLLGEIKQSNPAFPARRAYRHLLNKYTITDSKVETEGMANLCGDFCMQCKSNV